VGSQINNYKGVEVGGQSAKHVLFIFEDKQFRAFPIDSWYDFK